MVDGSLVKGFYAGTALEQKRPGATTEKSIDRVEWIMWIGFVGMVVICSLLTIFKVI